VTSACDGVGPICPSSCASDASCATGFFCASNGQCTPELAVGATCNTGAGKDCLVDGCRECASGTCTDGVCCATPCAGSCDVCAKSLGASADGTCSIATAGYVGSPACAPSLCGGASAACATTCDADTQCAAGAYCRASDHTCQAALTNGATCTGASQCKSGHCADGVCCDTACNGQCEACDASGAVGTCQGIVGAPHGTRAPCDVAPSSTPCTQTVCDGTTRTSCAGHVGSSVVCAQAQCAGGVETPESRCDGNGNCAGGSTKTCVPYVCGDVTCRTSCTADAQCANGYTCNLATNHCEAGTVCSADGTSQISADTNVTKPCAPYVCEAGKCRADCATSGDCAAGAVCDTTTHTCVQASGTSGAGGGCVVARGTRTASSTGAALGVAVALAAMARRRRRWIDRRAARTFGA
jgi:hypothetical protein